MGEGGGEGEAKLYDGDKAWSSINHEVHGGILPEQSSAGIL